MSYSHLSKLSLLAFMACLFSTPAFSQFTDSYTPVVSTGTLPDEFLRTARSISEEEVKLIPAGKEKTAKTQFAISNNYFLRNLLLSGDVLVNDPLTVYVNKVADKVLEGQPELRKQIRFYVTKSSDVNAYAFDKGYIFVNVGLLAQLENEAQLAFVLSHEIMHVVKKHSVTQYIENIRLDNGMYQSGSAEERSLAKYRFSKEQESEADLEGLALMKTSGYSIKALRGAFDVMQYSYLPFELPDFKKSFFEDKDLVLPDTLMLKTVSDIKANDEYDDSKSTHPNIRKRRGAIEPELNVSDESSRKKYLISEEEFKNIREISRFELCRIYVIEREYVEAVYAAYIQLQKYPDNIYLKKIMSTSLYNILVNKSFLSTRKSNVRQYSFSGHDMNSSGNSGSGKYRVPDYERIEGASQPLYYMLDNMTALELNAVTLSYTYKAWKKSGDKGLSALTDSLMSLMVNRNNMFLNDFSKKSKAELKSMDTVKVLDEPEQQAEESKYSKIKKQQQKLETENPGENFVKYSFVSLLNDPEFVARYSKVSKGLTRKPITLSSTSSSSSLSLDDEYTSAPVSAKKQKLKDEFLGIDRVAFLSPVYVKVNNDHGDETVDFYMSEDKQVILAEIQDKCADRLKLEHVNVSVKNLSAGDIAKFNNSALLNEWLTERFNHGDNNEEIVFCSENIQSLLSELGTKYVSWCGVYTSKGKVFRNYYFFVVLNIETGQILRYETRSTKSYDSRDLLSSYVYNSLMHVVKKPK